MLLRDSPMLTATYRNALWTGLVTALAIVLVQWLGRMAAAHELNLEVYGALVAGEGLLAGMLLLRLGRRPAPTGLESLTQRERQILQLMADGKANKEIAVALHVEVSTIKTHANNLFAKLGCANRREAQRLWAESPPSFHPRGRLS